jgi:Disulphide bond corrector protein DsbC
VGTLLATGVGKGRLRNLVKRVVASLALVLAFALRLLAQEGFQKKTPSVTMLPVPTTNLTRGKASIINFNFRIESGFHINSNKPSAEYLIPTILHLDPPTDLMVGKITYPPGEDMAFAFSPTEKLSVYSGEFTVSASVKPLSSVLYGQYEFHGTLRYQACDKAACYPPKSLPVRFEVKVVKPPPPPKKNPPQSPHASSS